MNSLLAPSLLTVVLGAIAGMAVLFGLAYLLSRRIDNYGVVDVVWSGAFAPLAIAYALTAPGAPFRRLTVALLASAWSLRLASHLCQRVARAHPEEDGRYQQLRKEWKGNFARKMAGFFQMQGVSVVILSIPFLLAVRNPSPTWHPLEIAGVALWLISLLGESLADAQLAGFKKNPANRGKVCDLGLWRYSRHPNYFFEWLIWVAFALFALASPWGALAVICPVIMYYLLTRVTGIRYTEEQLARSKGAPYRDYQRRTSAFFPWPPKSKPTAA